MSKNNKKPRNRSFYTYRLNVCRISYGNQNIEVVARNKREAQREAEDEAGNRSFTEHTSEYQTQTSQRLGRLQPEHTTKIQALSVARLKQLQPFVRG